MIEPLRGVAALSILVYHAGAFARDDRRGGWWDAIVGHLHVGVPIFFVLSGFLRYRPFVAARVGQGRVPSIGGYALRRIARIIPAYWAALVILGALRQIEFVGNPLVYFGFLQTYSGSTLAG